MYLASRLRHAGRLSTAAAYLALILAPLGASAALAQGADFYRGRQITLMVGSSPGGGYDAVARLIARHLGKHIPGNPAIIVENTPGEQLARGDGAAVHLMAEALKLDYADRLGHARDPRTGPMPR